MNLTRRLFASMMPAAPAAAAYSAGQIGRDIPIDKIISTKDASYGLGLVKNLIPEPAGLKAYWAAREVVSQARNYAYNLRDIQRDSEKYMCMNIQSLRSVSPTMKLHMEMSRRLRIEKEERTWSEALLDQFNLREYFKKQSELSGPQPAENRRY